MLTMNEVLDRLNITVTELNHLRDRGIIQQVGYDQYDQKHIESLYDEHRQAIKRRFFAYITDINLDFLSNIKTPNQAYIATVFKLQSTVSITQDILTIRLPFTEFNLELAKLIITELSSTQLDQISTTNSGKHKYYTLKFFSPSFINSLNNFDLISLPSNLHRHILRAIVELKFKINMKTATYSLQSTFQTNTIPHLITHIVYSNTTKQQNNPISQLHIRTTPTSTCIRFKLNAKDTSLIDYLYPPLNPSTLPYIHNQKMGEAITYFDSEY